MARGARGNTHLVGKIATRIYSSTPTHTPKNLTKSRRTEPPSSTRRCSLTFTHLFHFAPPPWLGVESRAATDSPTSCDLYIILRNPFGIPQDVIHNIVKM